MRIKEILKIGLFVIITSICFAACVNKSMDKKVEKTKAKNIENLLNESFDYYENQKLYKNRYEIANVNDANKLLAKFENLCSQKEGQLIGQAYFINKDYTKFYTNNKAGVCQINEEPFFIIHEATYNSNIYYTVLIDEDMMRTYHRKTKKQDFQIEPTVNAPIEQVMQERKEIQKREIAREQKTKLLLGQKNQKTMTFFDSWRYSGSEASCSKRCYEINEKNNGFKTLKEATSNNWQLVSKIEETEQMLDNSCTCTGSSVILKK